MKGSRPEQSALTADNDLSKTAETETVIDNMVDGLNDHEIDGIGAFFAESFRWMGNAGCGLKQGLQEFQDNWQRPFQDSFSDKVCIDDMISYYSMSLCHDGFLICQKENISPTVHITY